MENDNDQKPTNVLDLMLDHYRMSREQIFAHFDFSETTMYPLVDTRTLHWMLFSDETQIVSSDRPLVIDEQSPRGGGQIRSLFQPPRQKRVTRTGTHALVLLVDFGSGRGAEILAAVFDATLEHKDETLRQRLEHAHSLDSDDD